MRTQEQVDIEAPADVVWDVMTDVRRWPEWTDSITSVEALQDGPLRVGAKFRVRQPRLPRAVWEVTEVQPGRSFTWVNRTPGLVSTATHSVEGHEHRTSSGSLTLEQSGALSFLVRPYRSLTRRYVQLEAAGLKRRSEQHAERH